MEDKLRDLINGNNEENRVTWAKEWKKQGKKVIGVISSYVPEEVISAAGMLPWRVTGSWKENFDHARVYRSDSSCGYCNHVLESLLTNELDFLDGIVITDQDQDLLRLGDVIKSLNRLSLYHVMHIPFVDSELNYKYLKGEIMKLEEILGNFGSVQITRDSLSTSIVTYNKMRNLLNSIYELRKREIPPLSGSEVLGIITTAQIMPKDILNRDLEILLPYLEKRQTNRKQVHPRIMVSSEMLDNPAYISLIEEGCLVAMDDMDTGSRYFDQDVDADLEDLEYSLAKRYLSRHNSPRMANWDRQIDQIIKLVKEFNIDGVISFPQTWCYPQKFRAFFLHESLQKTGIPNVSLEREYHLSNVGQLRTRIGAFLEMISG